MLINWGINRWIVDKEKEALTKKKVECYIIDNLESINNVSRLNFFIEYLQSTLKREWVCCKKNKEAAAELRHFHSFSVQSSWLKFRSFTTLKQF